MSITNLSPLPSQSSRPDTFDEDVEGLFAKLPAWAADVDAARNQAVEAAGAGASGHRFNFDGGTAASDPTSGRLRFNNASLTAATAAYVSATSATGSALGALLDTYDDSTSAKKGMLRVVNSGDPSKFAIFYLTGVSGSGTYRTFTLVHVQSSSASPFVAGDSLSIQYAQIGDKGDKGDIGTTTSFPMLWVRDEKPSGTPGSAGGRAVGFNVRTLNTVKKNEIVGASVSSNRITLPVGTYRFKGHAPVMGVAAHQVRLYNVTAGAAAVYGSSEYEDGSKSSRSLIMGEIVVGAPTTYELQHYTSTSAGSMGFPATSGGVEVYSELIFEKVA